jgi:hypothetical protein
VDVSQADGFTAVQEANALVLENAYAGSGYNYTPLTIKGVLNTGQSGIQDAWTVNDGNVYQTQATEGNRPTASTSDTAIGVAKTGYLGLRAPSGVCSGINMLFASTDTYQECLSATAKTFTVPITTTAVSISGAPAGSFVKADGSGYGTPSGSGGGTVTGVGLTMPAYLTVSGSPITTNGTLAVTGTSEAANYFLAAPNGSSGAMSPRAIVAADVPTLNQSTTGNAATATALAVTPSQCSGGEFATGVAASGNANCGTPSGSGTVISFSAGNLSPLFTTSVATAASTPALSFSLSNAAQNSVFAGPASGGSGAPSFQTAPTISAANMTSFPTLNQSTTGNASTATSLASTPGQCSNGYYATGVTATGVANCAQVAYSQVSGAPAGAVSDIQITVGTTAIGANSCSSEFTAAMTGLTAAMSVKFTPATDFHTTTGWSAAGPALYFFPVPTAGTLDYYVCNNSSSSVTPGANTTWNVSAQ